MVSRDERGGFYGNVSLRLSVPSHDGKALDKLTTCLELHVFR